MLQYLLDTNIAIYVIKRRPAVAWASNVFGGIGVSLEAAGADAGLADTTNLSCRT